MAGLKYKKLLKLFLQNNNERKFVSNKLVYVVSYATVVLYFESLNILKCGSLSLQTKTTMKKIFIPAHLSSLEKTFFKTVYILLKIWYLQVFMRIMITWSQTGMMVDWSTLMNVSSATPRTRLTWKTRPDQMMFFISSVDHKNIRGGLTNQSSVLQYVNRDSRSTGWKVKSYFRDTLRKGEQDSIEDWAGADAADRLGLRLLSVCVLLTINCETRE